MNGSITIIGKLLQRGSSCSNKCKLELRKLGLHKLELPEELELHCGTAQAGTARGVGTAQSAQSPLIRTLGWQCFVAVGWVACMNFMTSWAHVARMSTRTHKSRSRVHARVHRAMSTVHAQGNEQAARTHARTHAQVQSSPAAGVSNCSPLGQLYRTAAV
jgi:hypothetical protein